MTNLLSIINVRHRFTQVIVLIILIASAMLFSQVANAQSRKMEYGHARYRIAIHKDSNKTCYILHKKRTSSPKHSMIASSRRSKNNKALAETEPDRIASSN